MVAGIEMLAHVLEAGVPVVELERTVRTGAVGRRLADAEVAAGLDCGFVVVEFVCAVAAWVLLAGAGESTMVGVVGVGVGVGFGLLAAGEEARVHPPHVLGEEVFAVEQVCTVAATAAAAGAR